MYTSVGSSSRVAADGMLLGPLSHTRSTIVSMESSDSRTCGVHLVLEGNDQTWLLLKIFSWNSRV